MCASQKGEAWHGNLGPACAENPSPNYVERFNAFVLCSLHCGLASYEIKKGKMNFKFTLLHNWRHAAKCEQLFLLCDSLVSGGSFQKSVCKEGSVAISLPVSVCYARLLLTLFYQSY